MDKKRMYTIIAILILSGNSGCSYDADLRRHSGYLQRTSVEQAPVVAATRSVSVLKDGLACMDRMLRDQNTPSTLIAVKNIPDASGMFSTSTKDMLITALSRMSRTSNAFRVVDYEIDPLRQDTVQNLTGLFLNSGMIKLQKPKIYISGSISFGDKTVLAKRKNFGVSTKTVDIGWGDDAIGSVVGLELHLGDMNTRTLYPGIDSANEVVVATGGRAIGLGGKATGLPEKIYELGVQFDMSSDNNQGAGAAVRALVDLAAIELVGKWSRLPYWQCIAYEQNHPEFQRQLREWYDSIGPDQRITTVQRGLIHAGYWFHGLTGKQSPRLQSAVARYQADYDLTPSGQINFETYERLMRNYVVQDEHGKFIRIGWSENAGEMASFSERPSIEEPPLAEEHIASVAPLIMQIIDKKDKYRIGDSIAFRIVPDKSGFLYCYYQDAGRTVTQVYPNILQKAATVLGNRAVHVADTNIPDSFLIELSARGDEEIFCALTEGAVPPRLPAELMRTDLKPIEGLQNLDMIKSLFSKSAKDMRVASNSLQWRVDDKENLLKAIRVTSASAQKTPTSASAKRK